MNNSFKFVDLFAGIGGFHAALADMGGECVFACEIDKNAASIYELNWNMKPAGDITLVDAADVPDHDVLCAGFPCQPFSKSGKQFGMEEVRGILFFDIMRIIREKHPQVVMLENVRNLIGPRHTHEYEVILKCLRDEGYSVSDKPLVISPHHLHPDNGGTPQTRDRVFIMAALDVGSVVESLSEGFDDLWSEQEPWGNNELMSFLDVNVDKSYSLTIAEVSWLNMWDDFIQSLIQDGGAPPSFPVWFEYFKNTNTSGMPDWKKKIVEKNNLLYQNHSLVIDQWITRHNFGSVPASRLKLEWQAGRDATSIWDCAIQFRPSGIRAKRLNWLPALVAINQTSIIGPLRRRITSREAARLQGFPDSMNFGNQSDSITYKQLGNSVNVGAVKAVLSSFIINNNIDISFNSTERGECYA